MTTFSFDTIVGQTTAFDADADVLNIAYGADQLTILPAGDNLLLTVAGVGSATLAATTLGELTTTNVTLASGTLLVGDNTTSDALDTLDDAGIVDTSGADLIYGMGGGDTINASNGGADVIYGGTGETDATDGGDTITLGTGSQTVFANAGDDTVNLGVVAAGETTTINLGLGDDTIVDAAAAGNLVITGNRGADTIDVQSATGDVSIFGGNEVTDSVDGADVITGGTGSNTIYGNGGADTITLTANAAAGATTFVNAGVDNDTIDATNAGESVTLSGGWGDDTIGLSGNNYTTAVVYGGNGLTDANTTEGVDTITVAAGTATTSAAIYGNAGDDIINFTGDATSTTAVTINGGLGDDTLAVTGTTGDTIDVNLGAGNDTATLTTTAGNDAAFNVIGYSTDDTLTIDLNGATAAGVTLAVGSASTVIDGAAGDGAVILNGYTGDLDLTLGSDSKLVTNIVDGADAVTFVGSATGDDQFVSGDADDTFSFATNELEAADVVTGGEGTDTLTFTGTDTIFEGDYAGVTGVENVVLGDFATGFALGTDSDNAGFNNIDGSALTAANALTIIDGTGEAQLDITVTGGAGDDIIRGLQDADGNLTISGNDGDDTIEGGASADTIDGGAGNDVIETNSGKDVVTGGAGTDTFIFDTDASTDVTSDATVLATTAVITDFSAVDDTLQFTTQGTETYVDQATTQAAIEAAGASTLLEALEVATAADGSVNAIGTAFQFGGNTYAVADYSADTEFAVTDAVVEITGLVTLTGADFTYAVIPA